MAGMASLAGATVGNWRLGPLLGEGAFGAVYEAEHVAIAGRRAAVKILHPHLSMQELLKQRFLNESSAASRAEHENIIQIFDAGIALDGTCYMAMERLRGQTLSQLLRRGRLQAERAIHIAAQIAGGLRAAHERQIVHRDLKPDNVFVQPRESDPDFVKILDFGVCKLRGDVSGNPNLTSTGMIIGTSAYMAPEQWLARPDVDGRADIYALGVILFECLAGQAPFHAGTAYEYMYKHMEEAPPDLGRYGVEPRLAQTVNKMLAKEPNRRQQSMREVIRDLRLSSEVADPALASISASAAPTTMSAGPRAPQPAPAHQPPVQSVQHSPSATHVPAPVVRRPPVEETTVGSLLENPAVRIAGMVVVVLGVLTYVAFNFDESVAWLRSQIGL